MVAYIVLLLSTALASAISRKNVMRHLVFWPPTIFIVGLKFEVGFDWHVYSERFYDFKAMGLADFVNNFWYIFAVSAQEPVFLIISFVSAKLFISYEIFQCAFYIFFVWSVFRLGNSIGKTNVVAAFCIIHLFVLFTLEMSTLRQMISLSIFHIALSLILKGRTGKSLKFSLLAPFVQASSLMYIIPAYWVGATKRKAKIWIFIAGLAVVVVNAIGFSQVLSAMGGVFPNILASKIEYYANIRTNGFSLSERAFFLVFYIIAIALGWKNRRNSSPQIRYVATLVVYLSILALVGFSIQTFRNRLLYEIVILVSLMLFTKGVRFRSVARMALIPMGLVFFAMSLSQTSSLVYVPYQNYIWYQFMGKESDGYQRQQILRDLINR